MADCQTEDAKRQLRGHLPSADEARKRTAQFLEVVELHFPSITALHERCWVPLATA